jgi:hypothetical protein
VSDWVRGEGGGSSRVPLLFTHRSLYSLAGLYPCPLFSDFLFFLFVTYEVMI